MRSNCLMSSSQVLSTSTWLMLESVDASDDICGCMLILEDPFACTEKFGPVLIFGVLIWSWMHLVLLKRIFGWRKCDVYIIVNLVKSDRCSLRFEYSLFSIHTVLFYLMCSGMLKIKKGSWFMLIYGLVVSYKIFRIFYDNFVGRIWIEPYVHSLHFQWGCSCSGSIIIFLTIFGEIIIFLCS